MRKALLGLASVLAVAAMTGPGAGTASAADMFEEADCRKPLHGRFWARANRAVLYAETDGDVEDPDGNPADNSNVFLVDNDHSSSRFGFKGKGYIDCFWSVGVTFELEAESNSSGDVEWGQELIANGDTDAGDSSNVQQFELKERIIEVWIAHKQWGKVSLGQGKHASDGTVEVDMSKTNLVGSVDRTDFMGDLDFGNTITVGTINIDDVHDPYDGLSREDRIRYDTPGFAGFMFSTSYNDSNEWDVALRYHNEFGGTKFAAAAHYAESTPDARSGDETFDYSLGGSASVLFPMGFNLSFAAATRDWDDATTAGALDLDGELYYGKVGWIFDTLFPWEGWTAISADVLYQKNHAELVDDLAGAGAACLTLDCAGWSYGVQVVHSPLKGLELYIGGQIVEVDDDIEGLGDAGNPIEEVFGIMTGMRVAI